MQASWSLVVVYVYCLCIFTSTIWQQTIEDEVQIALF